jgi:hypothetical protein
MFSPLQAYFLPTHGNGEISVLGKLPYMKIIIQYFVHLPFVAIRAAIQCDILSMLHTIVWNDRIENFYNTILQLYYRSLRARSANN